jgi:hypothetical protein
MLGTFLVDRTGYLFCEEIDQIIPKLYFHSCVTGLGLVLFLEFFGIHWGGKRSRAANDEYEYNQDS